MLPEEETNEFLGFTWFAQVSSNATFHLTYDERHPDNSMIVLVPPDDSIIGHELGHWSLLIDGIVANDMQKHVELAILIEEEILSIKTGKRDKIVIGFDSHTVLKPGTEIPRLTDEQFERLREIILGD
jgi:hypothetical protein